VSGKWPEVIISDWYVAPIQVRGETIFAIGDVHGCADHLAAVLEILRAEAEGAQASRLIFLGDLICRGPSSLDALDYWSTQDLDSSFANVDRLFGNHEQLLVLSMAGGSLAETAWAKWSGIGGETFVDELRQVTGRPGAPLSRNLLLEAAGKRVLNRLFQLQSHVWIGNTIFVHGGLDPTADPRVCLAAPTTTFGGNHWAWIQEPFLKWQAGFGGLLVIHGHTPPAKHRLMSGHPDPHVFQHDRLCLDGGSASTGIVVAAQIEDGRYRMITARAHVDAAN
jgi:serine/threonine protein phosphatase 1